MMGGAMAVFIGWLIETAARLPDPSRHRIALASSFALALVPSGAALLWMRMTEIDVLAGVAIGCFSGSMILIIGALSSPEADRPTPVLLASATGFAITVAAITALGIYRRSVPLEANTGRIPWAGMGQIFAALVPFALLVAELASAWLRRIPWKRFPLDVCGRIVIAAAIWLVVSRLLSVRLTGQSATFILAALGLAIGLGGWWLLTPEQGGEPESAAAAVINHWWRGGLSVLAILGAYMTAYQSSAGFGIGIVLLAAWIAVGLAGSGSSAENLPVESEGRIPSRLLLPYRLNRLLSIAVILLLYRLFTSRFADYFSRVHLIDHYAFFGFLVGAIVPVGLAGFLIGNPKSQPSVVGRLIRLAVSAVVLLMVPTIILIVWGAKCALALFIGLAFSAIISEAAPAVAKARLELERAMLLVPLLGMAAALGLTQWTDRALHFALLSRAEKIHTLLWLAVILAAIVIATDYGGRAMGRLRRRGARSRKLAEGVKEQ